MVSDWVYLKYLFVVDSLMVWNWKVKVVQKFMFPANAIIGQTFEKVNWPSKNSCTLTEYGFDLM